ncbi:hypothetical protein [Aliidiomarina quisquiliarum]|uniref:hypothetical protein n=1 Tax=Aliidiomarina quisquiliarum TaxID=2938947 RepID=UPI00208FCA77|nr:hypothetical protein [Aliidiomarina quisquiliarum]MCO4321497.1 hypothetical protein [Aliidiomarina quisquiliarum]
MSLRLIWILVYASVFLTACGEQLEAKVEQLDATASVAQLEDFKASGWRGCELGIEKAQRDEEMVDGTANLPFWNCRGVFENSYPYELLLVLSPNDENQVIFSQLEYRRGHQDSFNALLRYFLRLQGVENEEQRLHIRSQVTSVISSNPRRREFTPIMFLPDGRQIELAHNYPKMAFTTLRVRNLLADE